MQIRFWINEVRWRIGQIATGIVLFRLGIGKCSQRSWIMSTLGKKIDAVAADLAAHRAVQETHRGIYREGR